MSCCICSSKVKKVSALQRAGMSICAYSYCQRISGCSADALLPVGGKDKQEEFMEKYIIAVDMTELFLNSENKILERNRNVLQRLIDDGHYVVPATGRTRELILGSFLCSGV